MKIMNHLTWKSMWRNRTRTLVTIVGVALSAALFMSVTTAAYSIWDFMVRGYRYESGDFFITFDKATDAQLAEANADPAVTGLTDLKVLGYTSQFDRISPSGTYELAAMGANFLKQMSVPLTEGRLPENSGEIVLPEIYLSLCRAEGWEEPQVGDELTFALFSKWEEGTPGMPETEWEAQYTVVGIMKDRNYRPSSGNWGFENILTLADGNEGTAVHHRLFLKTAPWDAYAVSNRPWGESALNRDLLTMYGLTGMQNINHTLLILASTLLLIVMFASVSLIGNAFSVSIAERTRQFGLLSSVGATRRQIRAGVRFEARMLMALGIPVGLLLGFGGVALVLRFYGENLARLFTFSANGGVRPYATFSLIAAGAAALVCALTISLATWAPARRAAGTVPLDAIRQSRDITAVPKKVRVSPLVTRLFGIPGFMGAKYYRVSRRKYRVIVLALAFSMVLFVFSAYFADQMDMAADANAAADYDFSVSSSEDTWLDTYAHLRENEAVERSAMVTEIMTVGIVKTEHLHQAYRDIQENFPWDQPSYDGTWCAESLSLYYLEDEVFAAHLESEGIDPAPYLAPGSTLAVTVAQSFGGWMVQNEAGEWEQMRFYGHALSPDTGLISCLPNAYPDQIMGSDEDRMDENGVIHPPETARIVTEDGRLILRVGEKYYWVELTEETVDGSNVVRYHTYNPATGQADSQVAVEATGFAPRLQLGARLKEVPFGVSTGSGIIILVLPLSRLEAAQQRIYTTHLCLNARDYTALLGALKAYGQGNIQFAFTDYNEAQMNMRGIVKLIRVCATGFIALISLIACANALSTIATNVALRRKDYGMLRSMGFTRKHLYRMTLFECMNYALKAVLWSAPISIGLCWGLHAALNTGLTSDFTPPWDVFATGIGIILLVLFASALYAVFTIRKDNPIDAIRMENT